MDYGSFLDDAFTYTKEGVIGNLNRWAALIIALICLGIPLNGYLMRVYRNESPAPEADRWGTLFVDGIKLLIVGLVYSIPILIVWAYIYGGMILGVIMGTIDPAVLDTWEPDLALTALLYLVEIIVGFFVPVASIRFARTGSFSEAFNFSAICQTLSKIGWIAYLIALIIVTIVIIIPIVILTVAFIVIIGLFAYAMNTAILAVFLLLALFVLVMLIISPPLAVFQARYMTRVYDSAGVIE